MTKQTNDKTHIRKTRQERKRDREKELQTRGPDWGDLTFSGEVPFLEPCVYFGLKRIRHFLRGDVKPSSTRSSSALIVKKMMVQSKKDNNKKRKNRENRDLLTKWYKDYNQI